MEELNAQINKTFLGKEDHGIPTWNLEMKLSNGFHQGFGNYDLRFYGIVPIIKIIEVVGVDSWEKLIGTTCRVRRRDRMIRAIGHIVEDKWFDIEDTDAVEATEKTGRGKKK